MPLRKSLEKPHGTPEYNMNVLKESFLDTKMEATKIVTDNMKKLRKAPNGTPARAKYVEYMNAVKPHLDKYYATRKELEKKVKKLPKKASEQKIKSFYELIWRAHQQFIKKITGKSILDIINNKL